jgi:hypothetical protein
MNKYTWDGYKPESSSKNEEVKKEEKVETSSPKGENSPPVKQNDGGKGSMQRPINKNIYRKNWDNIFKDK